MSYPETRTYLFPRADCPMVGLSSNGITTERSTCVVSVESGNNAPSRRSTQRE